MMDSRIGAQFVAAWWPWMMMVGVVGLGWFGLPQRACAEPSAVESPNLDDRVQLTFPDNVPLKTVIDYIAARLGRNILYDDSQVNRTVTLRCPMPVDKDQLLELLRSALRFRGLALVEGERASWLKVIADEKLMQMAPHQLLAEGQGEPGGVVTHIFELQNIPLRQFADLATAMISKPGGNVLELPGGKAVVITDYRSTVEALARLQQCVDVPRLKRTWKIRPVAHVPVARIAGDLKPMVDQLTPSAGKGETVHGAPVAWPVARLNAYLLAGSAEQVQQMEQMLELLDVGTGLRTEVYRLEHADAVRAMNLLRQMLLPRQENSPQGDQWLVNADAESNSLIVTVPTDLHVEVARWIEKQLDLAVQATSSGVSTAVFQVRYARAGELAQTIASVVSAGDKKAQSLPTPPRAEPPAAEDLEPASQPSKRLSSLRSLMPSQIAAPARPVSVETSALSMTVHEATNSIIVTADRATLGQVQQLIDSLDRHRPQVLIDVTIVSINETDAMDLGLELGHIHSDPKGETLDRGVFTSFGLMNIDPAKGLATASVGSGLSAALLRTNEVSAMIRAFRSRLNGQVVAKPQLLVDDNATGQLNSINEQPYTSINAGQTVSTTSFAGYAEAGTQIKLTPHISEGDVVQLEYEILSSSFTGSSSHAGSPPPRATDAVTSQVTIPSGYVLLVGGLTRDNIRKSRSEVPWLADIPGLGEVFRTRSDSKSRTVLYVFLRPQILRQDRFAYLKFISVEAFRKAGVAPDEPAIEMEWLKS